jgi:phosphoribosyl-dephospho-CoA transferase
MDIDVLRAQVGEHAMKLIGKSVRKCMVCVALVLVVWSRGGCVVLPPEG